MILIIFFLLEILAIIVCLHCLYNERFQVDMYSVALVLFDVILFMAIKYNFINSYASVLGYFALFFYCGFRFGFHIKELVINNMLNILVIGTVQMICSMPVMFVANDSIRSITTNLLTLLFFIVFGKKIRLHQLSEFMSKKDWLYKAVLGLLFIFITYIMISYKITSYMRITDYIIIIVFSSTMCMLAVQWQRSKSEALNKTMELQMTELYGDSFKEVLEQVRARQHDFDNHIMAVYSQHATYRTYEELVNKQCEYCNTIREKNKFNKLLLAGKSMIVGFLYGKFISLDKQGIEVEYNVLTKEMKCHISFYEIVEAIGILIDNATEAIIQANQTKKIKVEVIETDEWIYISIKNPYPYVKVSKFQQFFRDGYSEKGEDRGRGLSKVKIMTEKRDCEVNVKNEEENEQNWVVFEIKIKKTSR